MRLIELIKKSSYKGISLPFIVFIFLTIVMLGVSYSVSALVEAEDSFCGTKCHVQPENKFYERTLVAGEKKSLAGFHSDEGTRCIDCHSRPNVTGRLWAQVNGLKNAISYLSGTNDPYNKTTRPVGESGCTKCHSEIFWSLERPSHYHSPQLNLDWKLKGGPPNLCEECHPSHSQESSKKHSYMKATVIHKVCKGCHETIGDENYKHLLDVDKLEHFPDELKGLQGTPKL